MRLGAVWSRLRAEPHPWRLVCSRLLWRAGLSTRFVIERKGYRVRFHPSAVSAEAWIAPQQSVEEEEFVASRLRAGDTYVDVGANVGLLALRAASVVGRTGRVIAIEAHPRTAGFLADNVALNGFAQVQVVHRAVGESDGTLTFTDFVSDDQNHVQVDGAGVAVRVQRLDELVPAGPIALLKVDVEGFELAVFRGAEGVLDRTQAVLFESWDRHATRYGHTAAEVVALLRARGFRVHRLVRGALEPVIGPGGSPSCENLVALRG